MARFRFRALDAAGASVNGELEAADRAAAVAALRGRGCLPVAVDPAQAFDVWSLLNVEITPRAPLTEADRIALTRGLATLVDAELPLERALALVAELGDRRGARKVAAGLLDAVRGGAALSAAMAAQPAAFPALYRGVVAAGEAGAALGPALVRLADAEEEAARRRAALRAALTYPVILVVASVGAVAVMLSVVVPTFEPLLADAGAAPPLSTQVVLAAARILGEGWPFLLGGAVALWLGLALALRHPAARVRWARFWLGVPGVGPLIARLESARLCRLLGELVRNDVALPAALRLTTEAMPNAAFRAELARATPEVEGGRGLSRPLTEGGIVTPLALQLIRVGEESGRLAPMLVRAGAILEADGRAALDRMLALLTPLLTLLMGAVIALIVSSILFALLQINELTL